MWDFSLTKAVGMVLRTLPFVILRLAVYFGIGAAYLLTVGIGAAIGWTFGRVASAAGAADGALWGGFIGFALTSAVLYLAREYILYLVKAAHIAVLVELLDGKEVPAGQGQLGYGAAFVRSHFGEASVLFGVDQIIKGVLRVIIGTLNAITAFLPIPALQTVMRMVDAVLRMSLTYVDEIILAYLIRTRTANPWETAKDGLILYAQNYKHFLKNAVWLALFMWGLAFAIFLVFLAPAAGILALFPGNLAAWGFAFAFIFAWAFKAALLEPVAIAAFMQVYFKTIQGQTPDAQWSARLSSASAKFRELGTKAGAWIPGPKMPNPGAAS